MVLLEHFKIKVDRNLIKYWENVQGNKESKAQETTKNQIRAVPHMYKRIIDGDI